MSIDYDLLVHRLHRGACAFQSLRAHRRQRGVAADPATVAEARAPSPPSAPPSRGVPDEAAGSRVTGSREPQAFIAVGDRVVPIFGDVNAVLGAPVAPDGQGASLMGEPPSPPRVAPAPKEIIPDPPPAPAVSASTLKLPVPTPPPRLGLINGGHARPPAPEPAIAEPAAAPNTARNAPAENPMAPPSTEEAAAILAEMFDSYAQQEVARLEKLHADHRAGLATLLQEHRQELRARSEADAARTAQLLRDVLAEHRAELARSAQSHAEQLAHVSQRDAAGPDLHAALIEQAKLQREANEDVADHISALTTIVADLGQTVGMLAVAAAQDARQGRLPTRPTFSAPPRFEPGAATPAPAQDASPGVEPIAIAPTANRDDRPSPYHAAHASASAPTIGSAAAAAIAAPTIPATLPMEAPEQRRIRLAQREEAAARARVRQFADECRDDDDLEASMDDDDRPRRPSLPPITDIDPPNDRGARP